MSKKLSIKKIIRILVYCLFYLFVAFNYHNSVCQNNKSIHFNKDIYLDYVKLSPKNRIKLLVTKAGNYEAMYYEFDNMVYDLNILLMGDKDFFYTDTLYHINGWSPAITIKDEVCDSIWAKIINTWQQKAKKVVYPQRIDKPCATFPNIQNSRKKIEDIIIDNYFGLSIFCRIELVDKNYEKIPIEVLEVIQKDLDTLLKVKTKNWIMDKRIDTNKVAIALNKWKIKLNKLCKICNQR